MIEDVLLVCIEIYPRICLRLCLHDNQVNKGSLKLKMGPLFHVFPLHRAAGVADLHSVPSENENLLPVDENCDIKILFFDGTLTGLLLCCN